MSDAAAKAASICGRMRPRRLPSAKHFWLAVRLGAAVSLWFLIVYGGADWLAGRHTWRIPIASPREKAIPYVPWAVWGYMSLYPLFALAPFVLDKEVELRQFALTLVVLIGISGIAFVALPAELAYAPPPNAGAGGGVMWLADSLNLTYNNVPSLHVGFSVVCAAVYAQYVDRLRAILLWAWAAIVALSTLLIHQHHVIDVATGWALALTCAHFGYRRPLRIKSCVLDAAQSKFRRPGR